MKLRKLNLKKKQIKYYINLFFMLLSTSFLAQKNDSIRFNCICMDASKQEIMHTIFLKSTTDLKYIVNFNVDNSLNDTLIIHDSKIYLKKISDKNVLFNLKKSKFRSIVYPQSGLGFKVYNLGKQKVNKLYYYKIGFDSFSTHVPFISSLTISESFDVLSFIYYDSNKQYNCSKKW